MDIHPCFVYILHALEIASSLLAKLHDVAHKLAGREDVSVDNRLLGKLDQRRVGVVGGVVDILYLAGVKGYTVYNRGRGGDKVEVVFAL